MTWMTQDWTTGQLNALVKKSRRRGNRTSNPCRYSEVSNHPQGRNFARLHGLRDLEEIQKKGISFFRSHFQGKAVFAWKSVVQNRDGSLRVPYLYDNGDDVVLNWNWLDNDWNSNNPALRFANLSFLPFPFTGTGVLL